MFAYFFRWFLFSFTSQSIAGSVFSEKNVIFLVQLLKNELSKASIFKIRHLFEKAGEVMFLF